MFKGIIFMVELTLVASWFIALVILLGFGIYLLSEQKTLSDFIAERKVKKGDTYRNYMKCKGQCGTCKHHKGNLKENEVLCKLNDEKVDERNTCDYYQMHRCFKKYERRM